MREDIAGPQGASSRPMWETLEGMVREKAQEFIQQIMEEEVTELLGREKSERRSTVDSAEGYRNGYGKLRRLAMSSGTITLRRPRVRGVEERFESRVLPLFARRTKELGALLPELYLHGLAEGDFELAMRGLLGEGAPLSKSSIRRLRAGWTAEFEEWSQRRLEGREVVYVWADGIYVKAGLERDKAALLVVLGVMRDGTKEALALRSGYRESVESWSEVLRDLKARGIEAPRLLMADGNAAIWGAVRQVWPEAGEQRCWNHKMRNVLDRLPQREQSEAKDLLRAVVYAPSRAEAVRAREAFARRYRPWYPKAVDVLEDDWERMVAFYDFPEDHWKHLRTTNVVESPFAAVRLRTTAAKRFKRVESATALIWKLLLVAEKRFRRLDAPHLEPDAPVRDTEVVGGFVREVETGNPIGAARVELRELRLATLTGADGRFLIPSVPPGGYTLDVNALGFRSEGLRRTEVTLDRPTILDVRLMRDPLALAEIVVAPGTFGIGGDEATLMRQTLTQEEMQALPQLGEDVFRMMERIPGVATGDISAKMNVRGAYPDELLIQLDGVELFEPYHMKDLDAVMGIVDVQTLRGLSLIAGGLPAEYGDRMTGLLDMRTKQPIGNGRRNSIGFSISNVTARSQGTFNDGRGGWMVSGRRGFLDILLALAQDGNDDNEDISPRYFDVMGKVEFLAGARHRFSAHILYAGDDLDLKAVSVLNNSNSQGELLTDWRNANAWLNWGWQLAPSLDASTTLSFASLSRNRSGFDLEPGSSEIADAITVSDRAAFDFLTAKQNWRWAAADRVVLKFGGQLRFSKARYNYRSEIGEEFDLGDGTVGVDVDSVRVSLRPESTETGAYLATRLQPHDRVVLEVGGRYDYRSHTSDSDISPRVQAALELTTNTTLRASWGAYYQSHGLDELSAVDGDTLFFPSERANQIAAGIEHGFARGWQVRAEVYHRTVSHPRPRYLNVIREIIPFPEVGNGRVRFLPERGRADGLELTLAGPLGNQSDWTASYVLARAEDRLDGRWVPRTLDQRHTFNTRWHYRPNSAWEFSAGWQYHTGWPSTPMEFQVDTLGTFPVDDPPPPGSRSCNPDFCLQLLVNERPGPINAERLPAYHRMDLRVTRTFQVGGGTLSAFLDVFNLYNRENLRSYDYKVELPSGRVIPNIGETLLPSFGLTWEF